VFALGNRVYPLWFLISVPCLVVVGVSFVAGTAALRRRRAFWPIFVFLAFMILVFLALDPLAPAFTETAGPRHVLPAWPALMLLVALGASRHRPLFVAISLVTFVCLGTFYADRWAYGETPQNWPAAAKFVTQVADGNTVLLYDGRSADPVRYYFPGNVATESYWPYVQSADTSPLLGYDRIIFLTNDFQDGRRREFDSLMRRIEEHYLWFGGRTDGSIKEYAFQRKPIDTSGYLLDDVSGQVRQPLNILGLEFDDLSLPVQADIRGHALQIIGAFSLPGLDGSRTRLIPLAGSTPARRLILVSSVIGTTPGGQAAAVSLHNGDGYTFTLPLRMGIETAAWDKPCPPRAPCQSVVQWHKRIALVGQRAYAGAWGDFQASLAGVLLPLPQQSGSPDQISFELSCDNCQFYVWAIAFLP
jgi:hypothetical protein